MTQRVESENNTIKLKGLHTASLVYLIQQIHIRLEKKKQYTEFENQKTQNIITSILHINKKFFESIIQILKEFLIPNILIIAKKRISKSILYEAIQISLNLNLDTLKLFVVILSKSASAFFNILLIPLRWYNNQAVQLSENTIRASPSIQLFNTSQSISIHSNFNLEYFYLDIICGGNIFIAELKENITDYQKYANYKKNI
ncbi:hypothetical protein RhiirA4_459602 [Rhizophagus irregularis]|uniref:Uncharacterized protein n=1 Tax=Rhizophagus irregularis TaxID=588596 RepID=A0A2I1GEQ0_9GLOM|nr:hypothetical protein RhiirA4_459602 [Rhizophagus irregularis]